MENSPSSIIVSNYSLRKKSFGARKDSSPLTVTFKDFSAIQTAEEACWQSQPYPERIAPSGSRSGSNISEEPQEFTTTTTTTTAAMERNLSALIRPERLAQLIVTCVCSLLSSVWTRLRSVYYSATEMNQNTPTRGPPDSSQSTRSSPVVRVPKKAEPAKKRKREGKSSRSILRFEHC